MARKTLLNESEIRRFMKLASINPLKEGSYMPGNDKERNKKPMRNEAEEETMDEGLFEQEEEDVTVDMNAEEPAPMDIGDEPAIPEEPAPMGMGDEGGMGEPPEEEFADIVDRLAKLLNLDAEVEVGGEEEGGDAAGIEGGEPVEPVDAPEAGGEDEEEEEADEEEEGVVMESEEEIIAEVARRVAARLLKEKKTEAMANKLAESIFRRLASK